MSEAAAQEQRREAISASQAQEGVRAGEQARAEASALYDEVRLAARAAFRARAADLSDAEPPSLGDVVRPLNDEEALRAFVGVNWGGYRALFLAMQSAPRLHMRGSLLITLFSGVWLLYRKQYVLGVGVLVAQALFAAFAGPFAPLAHLAVAAFVGAYGKSIVLKRGFALAAALPRETALRQLRRAGGVNLPAAALGMVLLGAMLTQRVAETIEIATAPASMLANVVRMLP